MKSRQVLCFAAAMALGVANGAGADMEHKSYTGSKEFERVKSLVGAWEGTDAKNPSGKPVRVEYRVTGAGSAVVETLFPGTPHEMVTVYYDKGGAFCMTHYCALGNRPQMSLKSSTAEAIELELAPGGEVNADRDLHMHALKITFDGADKIVHDWTLFEGGKQKDVSHFTFARVK